MRRTAGWAAITPLWNQKLSQKLYTPYNSTTYLSKATPSRRWESRSSLCLSCHDGTVAVGQSAAYGPLPTVGFDE